MQMIAYPKVFTELVMDIRRTK